MHLKLCPEFANIVNHASSILFLIERTREPEIGYKISKNGRTSFPSPAVARIRQ